MRSKPKNLDTLYLYADGHAVGVFREYHSKSGRYLEYVEIWEKFGPKVSFGRERIEPTNDKNWETKEIPGRLILSMLGNSGLFGLIQSAERVVSDSYNEDSKNILTIDNSFGMLTFDAGERSLSGLTIQRGNQYDESFNSQLYDRSIYKVSKVHFNQEKGKLLQSV